MTPTQHPAKTLSVKTGRFAVPFSLLRGEGSGAPSSGVGFGGGTAYLRTAGLLALTIVALLTLASGSASAAVARQYQSSITEAGGSPFGTLQGLAVDSAGNLYAADGSNHAVDKFDSTGAPVAAWGTGGQLTEVGTTPTATPLSNPFGLAVDGADNLWLTDTGLGAAYKLSPAGAFEKQGEGPEAGGVFPFGGLYIQSLAFSTSAAHLFVADSAEDGLHLLDSEGAFVETIAGSEATWGEGCCYIRTAADNSAGEAEGDVYVSDNRGAVYRIHGSGPEKGLAAPFSESGTVPYLEGAKLTGTPEGSFGSGAGEPSALALAVDSAGNLYVADRLNRRIDVFAPSGEYLGKLTGTPSGPFGEITALGVNAASGKLYVADATAAKVYVFGPPVIIPDVATKPATNLTTTSATLNGEVNPAGLEVEACAFEYGETAAYGEIAPCAESSSAIGEGNVPVPVHADVSNLNPGAEYHFRLIATNENGTNEESGDQHFFTGATIASTSVSAVTDTTALLETEINPRGVATFFHFEYDTVEYAEGEGPHGQSTPTASAGAGNVDVARTSSIGGLKPNTTYYFRVVAENPLGTVTGPGRAFTTQGSPVSLLPDERAWELVSPPDKHGAPLLPLGSTQGAVIQAAADGSALTYAVKSSLNLEAPGNRNIANSQALSSRAGDGAWNTSDITTPHQQPAGLEEIGPSEYRWFSADLSRAVVEPSGGTPLSPSASQRTPYLRLPSGEYRPLVTGCPEPPEPCPPAVAAIANIPPGTEFGGKEKLGGGYLPGSNFEIGTPDLSHLLFNSFYPLTSDFSPTFVRGEEQNIYEWSEGSLSLVSLIPPGQAPACGGSGPTCEVASEAGKTSTAGGSSGNQFRHAISSDGSRAAFFTNDNGSQGLYLRDLSHDQTLRLDAPEPGAEGGDSGPSYQDMSADGSRVFFTDVDRLTADSTAAEGKPDLYVCEVVEEAGGQLGCDLRDLTVDHNPGEEAGLLGLTLGASEDGSALYLVANDALAPGAVSGDCGTEGGGGYAGVYLASQSCNLYSIDLPSGQTHLVAVLSGADFPDWNGIGGTTYLRELSSRVSPNGRWLAFMSQRPLTGYDNRDAATGARDQEVFLYDSAANGGAGRLLCPSCNPTGARPRGVLDSGSLLVDDHGDWADDGGQTLAAAIPAWTNVNLVYALYQSRYLSDQGRLFFNAADPLVPQDSNGVMDVYQYEPPGIGDCTTSSSAYGNKSDGCVSLLSSGSSPEESAFLDASESGDDVFFLTASKLVTRDVDRALDVYDARVDGGEPGVVKPVECSADACQQPAVPPNDPTPGSLTFKGAGNLLQCPKGKVKKSGKCVKKRSKKKSHKKSKKDKRPAAHNRGGRK